MSRQWVLGAVVAVVALGCGSMERVVPKEDMAAKQAAEREAAARAEAERARAEEAAWTGPVAQPGQEVVLVGTDAVKVAGTDVVVQLIKTTWTTVETPKGESRRGTARLLLTKGDAVEMKELQVDEGSDGLGLGLRIAVSHAHEVWDDATSEYLPEAKLVVTLQ